MRTSTGSFSGSVRGISRNCKYLSAIDGARFEGLRGAAQIDEQRFNRSRFRLDHPEPADVGAQIVEQLHTPHAARCVDMLLDQTSQMLNVRAHAFGRDAVD